MTPWNIVYVWIAACVVMTLAWLVQLRTRNAGLVDAIWAISMGACALFYAWIGSGSMLPRVLLAVLGGIWGLRLGMHILLRVLGEPEDGRYRYLREHWHDNQANFFGFFMIQAVSIALFTLPFYAVAQNPRESWSIWFVCAVAIWLTSLLGESIADAQLSNYRKNPQNHGVTCRIGLWRYSRHPNYFFEWLHWFAYVFLAIGASLPVWSISLLGPVLMLASLCWVSGIPFTEAQALRSRGEDYRAYQRTTSMLIPWPPKSKS